MKIELQHDPASRHRTPGLVHRRRVLRRLVLCVALAVIGLPVLSQTAARADDSGPVPLVTQIADEPISVSAAEFRRHLLVAADAVRLSDPSHTADLLAERVLQHVYALDPEAGPAAAADAVQSLLDAAASVSGPAFDARITRTMVLFQSAAAADRGPIAGTLQRATTEVVALTAQQLATVSTDTHAESALGTTGDTESRLLSSPTFTPTAVLLDSATLADANAAFAAARDLLWEGATGVSISATSDVLLSTAPRLEDNPEVQALAALRDRFGNLTTTGGVIAGTPTAPAPHTIGATMAELGDALATSQEAAAASTGPDPVDDDVAEQAIEDAQDSQTTLALQTGFLTGGTSTAKDIVDQVGATAIQVTLLAMAFNDFRSGEIGRAALSGNAIGVVMTLLPAVLEWAGVFGPSGEDLIMTQLDNISQQMADFQNAVTGQFTQVFESLSHVSAQLDDISQKLDRAVIDIEQARVQIGQMYDSLSRLQGSLDAVQNNILEALRNGTNSQLRETIDSALGYQDRNGTPLPLDRFNSAAAYLHTFVTVTARHSPELNTDFPSFDPSDDANQLSTGIASNVHFLDQVPAERGWRSSRLSGLSGDAPQLANTDDFVLASRAYAQLMLENPGYVTAGYRRWLSDIQQQGGPLATLTSAISTSDTTEGTHSTLLNHLVCARTSAASAAATCRTPSDDTTPVDSLVGEAAGQLSDDLDGYDGPGNKTPAHRLSSIGAGTFDPFVDIANDPSDLSSLWATLPGRDEVAQCGAATGDTFARLGAMERPASLTPTTQGVPQDFQWADRMGLGTLDVCYKVTTRTKAVDACLLDDYMVVNRLSASECKDTFVSTNAGFTKVFGTATQARYLYDDIAFVWTFTPAGQGAQPIYVQSLVRRGAANGTVPGPRGQALPAGGYVKDTTKDYESDVDLDPAANQKFEVDTDSLVAAPLYASPSTPVAVKAEWGDATRTTSGVSSYQAASGVINAGDALDQPIAGLDPKLGTGSVKYARTCTAADTTPPCQGGTGGVSILSLARATQDVDDAVDANLVDLQGEVYRRLLSGSQTAGSTSSGPLHDALVRLDGANAMLSSFLQLGASGALRQHDLTGLPGGLGGAKALVAAIRGELAKTNAGTGGVAPDQLVTDVLEPDVLDALDGLLPLPQTLGRSTAAAGDPQSVPGPVHPALLATNDQLTLTAVALGAPPAPAPKPTTPPAPTPAVTPAPTPAVTVAFGDGWRSSARRGKRYASRVTATGGTGTYRWARVGRLPLGLQGKATPSGRAYVVSGRPVRTGTYTFTLTATDANGATTTQRYRIRVR